MGFINLNGQSVHTSALGNPGSITNSTWSNSTNGTWINGTWSSTTGSTTVVGNTTLSTSMKTTYHILGEDVEVNGFKDGYTAQNVALVNVLGKNFYDELKKQNISFPSEIEDFLSKKFITIERDKKIDDIIK